MNERVTETHTQDEGLMRRGEELMVAYWYDGKFESVFQNRLSELVVIQNEICWIPVQPVDQASR